MATVPPPPSKRQKVAAEALKAEETESQKIPDGLGHVRVQFVEAGSGQSTGIPVNLPVAQTSAHDLEAVVNDLVRQDVHDDDEEGPAPYVPYTFTYTPQRSISDTTVDITSSIYHTVLKTGLASNEEILTLQYVPQAVFRVRAPTRLSSSIAGHGQPVLCVSFPSSTSSRMASGSGDGTARIWDCDTGTPFKTLKGHTSWVLCVGFSPDGRLLATGGMEGTIRIWSAETGDLVAGPLKGHAKWITSLAWEPYYLQASGRPRVASSSKDGTVRVWSAMDGRCDMTLAAHKGTASCVRWGGTGTIYSSGHDKAVRLWDANSGACLKTLGSHAHWVNHLSLSTEHALRTSFYDPMQPVPATDELRRALAKRRFETAARTRGEITERFVSASDDCTLYLWTPSSNKPIAHLLGHQKQVNHVSFSPSGHLIASCGFDNCIKIWRGSDGQYIRTLRGHVGAVYMCAWSADGRLLVSASRDSTVKVWDVKEGKLKEDMSGSRDEVYAVDWSAK
ncbi:MAG: hypothetical protein Q9162_006522 [Coniocarpon cinnabarinum]